MPTLLLTGFGPFGSVAVNPSQTIAERLDGVIFRDLRVVSHVLPVVFGADSVLVESLIARHGPVVVLSLGVAVGDGLLRIETQGRNLRQSPDGPRPIVPGDLMERRSTISVPHVLGEIQQTGVPVRLSDHAGDYLCNHVLYNTLRLAERDGHRFQVGFLHIPQAAEYDPLSGFSLPLALIELGVRAALTGIARSFSNSDASPWPGPFVSGTPS